MDYLAAMRVYVRVVERGSMSAAARDLGIGQPAVSERMERLEAELGARLLRRNTRAISVTDVGAAFYERSKLAIQAADDALSAAREDKMLQGTVRIAAPYGLGETLLPPVLLRLREEHPELRIDLMLNDRLVDPVTEGVDLSLRLGPVGEGGFAARRLGEVRRLLVAAPSYVERHGEPREPGDLIRHAFGRVAGLFGGDRIALTGPDDRPVMAPIDIVLTVSHWRPLHALILAGGVIGVLQHLACREDLQAGRLVPILPAFAVPALDFHILYGAARSTSPRVRKVMSLIEEEASRLLS
jgi:DNA-binding transcriptional LysR family regulator